MADLNSRSSNLAILIYLELIFFITAAGIGVWSAFQPALHDLSTKVWEVFIGVNGALFLALKTSNDHVPPPPPPAVAGA